jgi:hypothetical protein
MTNTEFSTLMVLTWCLAVLCAWLWLRRTTAAERRKKLAADLRIALFVSAVFIVPFALSFILSPGAPPSSVLVVCMSLLFLLNLGTAVGEIRIAFRAKNADDQRFPAGSDS